MVIGSRRVCRRRADAAPRVGQGPSRGVSPARMSIFWRPTPPSGSRPAAPRRCGCGRGRARAVQRHRHDGREHDHDQGHGAGARHACRSRMWSTSAPTRSMPTSQSRSPKTRRRAPTSMHGMMHLAREIAFRRRAKAPLAILRPSLIYGAGDPHNGYGPTAFAGWPRRRGDRVVRRGRGTARPCADRGRCRAHRVGAAAPQRRRAQYRHRRRSTRSATSPSGSWRARAAQGRDQRQPRAAARCRTTAIARSTSRRAAGLSRFQLHAASTPGSPRRSATWRGA